jgi:hypothetical protein
MTQIEEENTCKPGNGACAHNTLKKKTIEFNNSLCLCRKVKQKFKN